MTLYWYVHWFWITCQCYVYLFDIVSPATYSVTEEPLKVTSYTTGEETHRTAKVIGKYNIPPIILNPSNSSISSTSAMKLHKTMNLLSENSTRKLNSTTVYPPVNKTTVIDANATDLSLNFTDNQTLINSTFNAANRTENLTYFEEEKYVNKSFTFNSEQVLKDELSSADNLSAAGITGITLGCVSIVGLFSAVSYILYRNRGFNRPQVLNDHCSNLDSSGYIDDTSVRDNSEEMYSLDNDSFLNSLEAMTIQNYWTDTVKHTKL